jgi:Outer membrane protein beta-barrel domain
MKKILILLFVLFLSAEVSYGQFAFGLKLGYNASKLTSNIDSVKASINSGFHAGAFVRFGKRVYLQPEAYYTFSGGTFQNNVSNTINNWKQKVSIGTLDIPVLVGFKIINMKILNWRIMAGPEVSFLVNSKVKDVNLTGPITSSDINKVNWYGQVGTGIDILFLTFDIRYQFGFNSVINSVTKTIGTTQTTYPVNSKNNLFLVSLGFKIL